MSASPTTTHTPVSVAELAATVEMAARQGRVLTPWGAGTLQHLGRAPLPEAEQLCTGALNRILEYNPADLTITVEAGATLADAQAALREHGQWLPWDPPAPDQATIGGLLAAGASGPLRLGYGTPRDWVLGMRVVLGDGRLVKSGGKVVKNVAGYDTHKVQLGALGTLGVIAEATLKVAPLPEEIATLVFACADRASACALALRLRDRPLAPASLAISEGDEQVLLAARFAGLGAAVARQIHLAEAAGEQLGAHRKPIEETDRVLLWQALAGFANPQLRHHGNTSSAALIIRAGAPLAALEKVLAALHDTAPVGSAVRALGHGGVGLAYARWYLADETGEETVSAALSELRGRLAALGGYAVVEDAPAALGSSLDIWGPPPATIELMRGLKAQWDPQNILNRGRYVGGI